MRKLVLHVQSTLNGCISTTDGTFWEPFPWGDSGAAMKLLLTFDDDRTCQVRSQHTRQDDRMTLIWRCPFAPQASQRPATKPFPQMRMQRDVDARSDHH